MPTDYTFSSFQIAIQTRFDHSDYKVRFCGSLQRFSYFYK